MELLVQRFHMYSVCAERLLICGWIYMLSCPHRRSAVAVDHLPVRLTGRYLPIANLLPSAFIHLMRFRRGICVAKKRVNAVNRLFSYMDEELASLLGILDNGGDDEHEHEQDDSSSVGDSEEGPRQAMDLDLQRLHIAPFTGVDKCTAILRPKTRSRFQEYIARTCYRLIAISGFAGSGKTTVLATCAILFLHQADISLVFASAPTHVAVSNIATRIDTISHQLKYPCLVVRGYKLDVELRNFLRSVQELPFDNDKWSPSPWEMPLSVCFWLLEVVSTSSSSSTLPKIVALRDKFTTDVLFSELRDFVAGTPFAECHPLGSEKPPTMTVIRHLASLILAAADVVCTTPYTSQEKPYKAVCGAAGAVVLDEAGALTKSDALMVWGPYMCPALTTSSVSPLRLRTYTR
ncbi:dna helicase [Ophiostoma piceae UAMH 11346]|uniref:Dna helicase n=1 Tax=Ophiostoma piceae (strain UAMH 11346) TaxID=1262450 RepID=S3D383_OPHP1|nr:dna helicase [Ophiostoma piceae UAMH 11346]